MNKYPDLELQTVIGFGGKVRNGLKIHPSGKYLIYPLGQTLVLRNLPNIHKVSFLNGDCGEISCVSISRTGRYIAVGHKTHMGFKADIIIWDFKTKKKLHQMKLHKVKVQDLSFSYDERFLLSTGGQDDNNITIWDIKSGKAICGIQENKITLCCSFFNKRNDTIIVGGKFMLKTYKIDFKNRKLDPSECNLGILKRVIISLDMSKNDDYCYVGTTSGDVLSIQMKGQKNFKRQGPKKKFSKGVSCVTVHEDGNIIAGGGDGTIAVLDGEMLSKFKSTKLLGEVTSICPSPSGKSFYVGTSQSVIYLMSYNLKLDTSIILTCHSQKINDIAYPKGTNEIIVTCSVNDIRLWNVPNSKELVRIQVPNLECNCVTFSPNGKSIVSGWSDGKIRAFGPQSGKLIYVINDAHKSLGFGSKKDSQKAEKYGVTSLTMSSDNKIIVSGGSDGSVRVWEISRFQQKLLATMKEHKSAVNRICIKEDCSECVSASDDGSCIIWDLSTYRRSNIMYQQTYFKDVKYLNDESQILTTGSDRQITYWDSFNCNEIRVLEGSEEEIYALDISPDGEFFVSGGADNLVKLWGYDDGEIIQVGEGHSGDVINTKFSPDQKYITSVGTEGAIFVWKMTKKIEKNDDDDYDEDEN